MKASELSVYWNKRLEEIPTIKSSKMRLFSVLEDDQADLKDIERIIAGDPAMAAKVVKIANSPFYRHEAEIGSIHDAILTIGLDMVKCLTLSMSIIETFGSSRAIIGKIWEHSYLVGILSLSLARNKTEGEWLFSGGLLHDLGKMAFMYLEPALYAPLFNDHWPVVEEEQRLFSTDHTYLGEHVARQWHFPDGMINIIKNHHNPCNWPSATIHVVDHVIHCVDSGKDPLKGLDGVKAFLGKNYNELVNRVIEHYTKNSNIMQDLF
ncbi:MAG: hypothetical protein DRG37_04690 [Deltaproteobacteria bacterium]|nr:MAG: hypothetical protein DRG37_04690 [Deltaproteobacteria bacterium]